MFRKIFSFDRSLPSDGIRVTVVHGAAERPRAVAVAEAFKAAGVNADLSLPHELDAHAGTVLYVLPAADIPAVRKYCGARHALSISGIPAMVARGEVAMALEVGAAGRTDIWVHLGRLKDEEHELDSGLLRLAKIVR